MIVQPTFYIPPEIAAGILSGDFIRYGGVVRDTAGRLVTHLKEVPTPEKAVEEVAKRAALTLKNPWVDRSQFGRGLGRISRVLG